MSGKVIVVKVLSFTKKKKRNITEAEIVAFRRQLSPRDVGAEKSVTA